MIRQISERQQPIPTIPNRRSSRLRGAVVVAAGVALIVALLAVSVPALYAVQHHTPHPTMLACGGISLPC
jgi:hypothetical protein